MASEIALALYIHNRPSALAESPCSADVTNSGKASILFVTKLATSPKASTLNAGQLGHYSFVAILQQKNSKSIFSVLPELF
jgi:hypothetical protein